MHDNLSDVSQASVLEREHLYQKWVDHLFDRDFDGVLQVRQSCGEEALADFANLSEVMLPGNLVSFSNFRFSVRSIARWTYVREVVLQDLLREV